MCRISHNVYEKKKPGIQPRISQRLPIAINCKNTLCPHRLLSPLVQQLIVLNVARDRNRNRAEMNGLKVGQKSE